MSGFLPHICQMKKLRAEKVLTRLALQFTTCMILDKFSFSFTCAAAAPAVGGCPCCACRVAWASGHHRGRGPGGCGEPASRTHPAVPWFPGWQLEARLRCCSWAPRRPQGRETDFGEPVLRLLPTPPPLPTSSAGARGLSAASVVPALPALPALPPCASHHAHVSCILPTPDLGISGSRISQRKLCWGTDVPLGVN